MDNKINFDYTDKTILTKEQALKIIQTKLEDMESIQSDTDISDPDNTEAWYKEQALMFAKYIIERIEY